MTDNQRRAYEWAKNQNYPSVAARYAKELAELVDELQGAIHNQPNRNDWVCTLKCTALMEEGMCSHGGLCCLHESQRIIQEKEPLTLDELRQMDGEPVWVVWPDGRIKSQWFIISSTFLIEMFQEWGGTLSKDYGKTWLAYRQKPEERTV